MQTEGLASLDVHNGRRYLCAGIKSLNDILAYLAIKSLALIPYSRTMLTEVELCLALVDKPRLLQHTYRWQDEASRDALPFRAMQVRSLAVAHVWHATAPRQSAKPLLRERM